MRRRFVGLLVGLVVGTVALESHRSAVAALIDPFTVGSHVSSSNAAGTGVVAVHGGLFDSRQVDISTYADRPRLKTVDIAAGALSYTASTGDAWAFAVTRWTLSGGQTVNMSQVTSFSFDYSIATGAIMYDLSIGTESGAGFVLSPRAIVGNGTVVITLQDLGAQALQLSAVNQMIFSLRQYSGVETQIAVTNFQANGVPTPAASAPALLGALGLVGARRRRR